MHLNFIFYIGDEKTNVYVLNFLQVFLEYNMSSNIC